MEIAIGAAHWVVSRALGPVTDGLLESWAASSELGPNVRALKLELLYAEGMLNNARGRDVHNPALGQLLLELQNLAYNADDVLDELEYFRIQDELEGTFETIDADDRGLVGSLVLNSRHTARAVASKLKFSSCSCAGTSLSDVDNDEEDARKRLQTSHGDQEVNAGCVSKLVSSARNTAHAVGKRLPCHSPTSARDDSATGISRPHMPGKRSRFLCGAWSSKAKQREYTVHRPRLQFDRVEFSKRMKGIVEELKPLCAKVATILELELFGSNRATKQSTERPKTTPDIIEPKLYGRDDQKKNVIFSIADGKYSSNDVTVFSIVGPGGIGKTAFTQHIYEELRSHFPVPIWVCVSLDFSANRLREEIVKMIPKVKEENENDGEEERIRKRLQSKAFLLVLDDMWTDHEDEWKKLLAPFKKVGTKGNIVIVTTRIPKVAKMVATLDCLVSLERLEHKDCMHYFEYCVFSDKNPWKDNADLHKIGEDIVKKLKGSPLAVKTVGRLLTNEISPEYWRRVLESREWEHQTNDDDIMPALKLSFNYLPFDLQQCFSYCGLFPEDYAFDSKELIQLWIGLGLLSPGDKKKRIEDIGEDYINALVNYGFLQKNFKNNSQPYYLIHDLLHELAVIVSSYECLRIHGSSMRSLKIPRSIRHLSIVIDNVDVKDRISYENCKMELSILRKRLNTEKLRTLMLFGQHHGGFFNTLGDLFRNAKALRVIVLSEASYNMEDLFHNISELVHLRYLRISQVLSHGYSATHIANGISRLYHMMVLDLQHCNNLSGSLREISNLVRIRHLLVPDVFHSEIFEVGKLKSLQELRRFEVKKEMCGFELKQLGQLLELQGSLEICNLERVEALREAGEAKLEHMDKLNRLVLVWGTDRSSKEPKKEDDVLESLKAHSNVRGVCIRGHGGTIYPKWLGADLFNENLESLCLDGVAWKSLPLPGALWMANDHCEECLSFMMGQSFQNLKRIELVDIQRLKKWSVEDTDLFRVLEVLVVSDCPELIELSFSHASSCPSGHVDMMNRFPKIRKIKISKCPKLLSMPPIPWTSALRKADIAEVGTDIKELSYKKNEKAKRIKVQMGKDGLESELGNMIAFNNLSEIEELDITKCPPVSLEHMNVLASLKKLRISSCTNVLWPVQGENILLYQFPVEDLMIHACDATGKELSQFLSYFPNLSILQLRECKTVTPALSPSASDEKTEDAQIGVQQKQRRGDEEIEAETEGLLFLPRQIKELYFFDCPYLQLCTGFLDGCRTVSRGLQGLGSLKVLRMSHRSKFFPNSSSPYCPFPTTLQHLYLLKMDGVFTLEPLSNLTYLFIRDCGDLTGDLLWPLLAQGHLTELFIYGCPNLFIGLEPSRLDEQNPCYRVQELRTDGKAGILAASICAHLSASLTKLVFIGNDDIERFTDGQEGALQILTSLQKLEIWRCKKLQSLPAGLNRITTLKTLRICECESIWLWPKAGLPSSLTKLTIKSCPAIRLPPKGNLPSSLQTLDVSDSNNNELKRHCSKLRGTIPIIKA